jgi:hypothetical protein
LEYKASYWPSHGGGVGGAVVLASRKHCNDDFAVSESRHAYIWWHAYLHRRASEQWRGGTHYWRMQGASCCYFGLLLQCVPAAALPHYTLRYLAPLLCHSKTSLFIRLNLCEQHPLHTLTPSSFRRGIQPKLKYSSPFASMSQLQETNAPGGTNIIGGSYQHGPTNGPSDGEPMQLHHQYFSNLQGFSHPL